jgi:hypothetical protein
MDKISVYRLKSFTKVAQIKFFSTYPCIVLAIIVEQPGEKGGREVFFVRHLGKKS